MWIVWLLLIILAIYIIALAFTAIAYMLAYLGLTIIIPLDFFSSAFTWLGITTPAVGWLLYGCLVGGVIGLVIGFKEVGRTSDLWKVYTGATALLSLIFFGSYMAYSSGIQPERQTAKPVSQSTPPTSTLPIILGKWAGSFSNKSAALVISNVRDNNFSGTLTVGQAVIEVNGSFIPNAQQIVIRETRILSRNKDWALGVDTGSFSNDGKTMSGTGKDSRGSSYSWSFTKR